MSMEGALDYQYAKTLPEVEIMMLSEMINEKNRLEMEAINKAKK